MKGNRPPEKISGFCKKKGSGRKNRCFVPKTNDNTLNIFGCFGATAGKNTLDGCSYTGVVQKRGTMMNIQKTFN